MVRLVHGFLLTIVLYHLLHTGVVYGLGMTDAFIFSLLKDIFRIIVVGVSLWMVRRAMKLQQIRWLGYPFLLLVIGSAISYGVRTPTGSELLSFLVGMKYDVFPLFVLVAAGVVGVGYIISSKKSSPEFSSFLFAIIVAVIGGGLIRQVGKVVFPDIFFLFGYGPVGDYVLGANPPLYYRTGPGGMMRFSGIFAGPNNMGYFLVGFFSRTVRYCMNVLTSGRKKRGLLLLYAVVTFRTFSRGARIGIGIQIAALARRRFPQRKRYVPRVLGIGVVGFAGISFYKAGSTSGHIVARQEGVTAIMANPRGYGPGSSGPSVHYKGAYLPENQYLQIILDLGIVGCIWWLRILGMVIKELMYRSRHVHTQEGIFLSMLLLGVCGLLIEGFFLHTLEDSMVNYILFTAVMVYAAQATKSNN